MCIYITENENFWLLKLTEKENVSIEKQGFSVLNLHIVMVLKSPACVDQHRNVI